MLAKGKSFTVGSSEDLLIGRESAKKVLDKLVKQIEASSPFTVIPVDFGNMRFVDFSSADEFLGKLISRISAKEFPDIYVYLTDLNKEIEETIDAMLKLRGQNAAVLEKGGKVRILGKLNPVLKETFDYIHGEKTASARNLADSKKIAINASSNRLTTLHRLGLIARLETEAGRGIERFVYRSVCV